MNSIFIVLLTLSYARNVARMADLQIFPGKLFPKDLSNSGPTNLFMTFNAIDSFFQFNLTLKQTFNSSTSVLTERRFWTYSGEVFRDEVKSGKVSLTFEKNGVNSKFHGTISCDDGEVFNIDHGDKAGDFAVLITVTRNSFFQKMKERRGLQGFSFDDSDVEILESTTRQPTGATPQPTTFTAQPTTSTSRRTTSTTHRLSTTTTISMRAVLFQFSEVRDCDSATSLDIADIKFYDKYGDRVYIQGNPFAIKSQAEAGSSINEAFDGNINTKWSDKLIVGCNLQVWMQVICPSNAASYTLTTSKDSPTSNDPFSWVVSGMGPRRFMNEANIPMERGVESDMFWFSESPPPSLSPSSASCNFPCATCVSGNLPMCETCAAGYELEGSICIKERKHIQVDWNEASRLHLIEDYYFLADVGKIDPIGGLSGGPAAHLRVFGTSTEEIRFKAVNVYVEDLEIFAYFKPNSNHDHKTVKFFDFTDGHQSQLSIWLVDPDAGHSGHMEIHLPNSGKFTCRTTTEILFQQWNSFKVTIEPDEIECCLNGECSAANEYSEASSYSFDLREWTLGAKVNGIVGHVDAISLKLTGDPIQERSQSVQTETKMTTVNMILITAVPAMICFVAVACASHYRSNGMMKKEVKNLYSHRRSTFEAEVLSLEIESGIYDEDPSGGGPEISSYVECSPPKMQRAKTAPIRFSSSAIIPPLPRKRPPTLAHVRSISPKSPPAPEPGANPHSPPSHIVRSKTVQRLFATTNKPRLPRQLPPNRSPPQRNSFSKKRLPENKILDGAPPPPAPKKRTPVPPPPPAHFHKN